MMSTVNELAAGLKVQDVDRQILLLGKGFSQREDHWMGPVGITLSALHCGVQRCRETRAAVPPPVWTVSSIWMTSRSCLGSLSARQSLRHISEDPQRHQTR